MGDTELARPGDERASANARSLRLASEKTAGGLLSSDRRARGNGASVFAAEREGEDRPSRSRAVA
jgi:hypothetical protein